MQFRNCCPAGSGGLREIGNSRQEGSGRPAAVFRRRAGVRFRVARRCPKGLALTVGRVFETHRTLCTRVGVAVKLPPQRIHAFPLLALSADVCPKRAAATCRGGWRIAGLWSWVFGLGTWTLDLEHSEPCFLARYQGAHLARPKKGTGRSSFPSRSIAGRPPWEAVAEVSAHFRQKGRPTTDVISCPSGSRKPRIEKELSGRRRTRRICQWHSS
jgi:hypothetical protein